MSEKYDLRALAEGAADAWEDAPEAFKPILHDCSDALTQAADKLDRLKSELDAKTTTLAYLQQNEDAAAGAARQAAVNAIRECERLREDRDRLQAMLDTICDGAESAMWRGSPVANVNLWQLPRCDGRNGPLLEAAEKARTKCQR